MPPILLAESQSTILPSPGWTWTIAPAYAGVLTAFPILDRLGVGLEQGSQDAGPVPEGLGWSIALALLAVLACYALVYFPLARWGHGSGRRLALTSASALGTHGAEWLAGMLVAAGAVVSYAVALHMALRLVFLGLLSGGLVDRSVLQPWNLGPIVLESPVFLVTAVFWIFITGMTAVLRIPSVIFALMQVYTPAALLLLGVTAMATAAGLPAFLRAGGALVATGRLPVPVFQIVFAAFALPGLFAIDWGATASRPRDLRLGGWAGVLAAGSFAAVMAILTVAGAIGSEEIGQADLFPEVDVLTSLFSLHWAILHGIEGPFGATILLLFGLASLAPACYAVWVYSERLAGHWPALGRAGWTWLGGLPAFLLAATSWAGRLETIFGWLGACFAPLAGVIAADALRHRFHWPGVRARWHAPGLIGWACGLAVGLALRGRAEPAALFGYLASAAAFLLAGAVVPARPSHVIAVGDTPSDPAAPSPTGSAGP